MGGGNNNDVLEKHFPKVLKIPYKRRGKDWGAFNPKWERAKRWNKIKGECKASSGKDVEDGGA